MNLNKPMPLAALTLGFDPIEVMARAKAKGYIRACAPLKVQVLRCKHTHRLAHPELTGLSGPAYHRAYRKLKYLEQKLKQKAETV